MGGSIGRAAVLRGTTVPVVSLVLPVTFSAIWSHVIHFFIEGEVGS